MKMTCPSCGEDFERLHNRQRFCSVKCRSKDQQAKFYKRHRERKLAKNKAYFLAHHKEGLRYRREWHAKHREESNTRKKQWYADHREHASRKMKQYRAENREPLKQKAKERYQQNCEDWKAKSRANHHANRERRNERRGIMSQKARLSYPWRFLLHSAKDRARKKNLPFDLTDAWASERWTGSCELTGVPFQLGQRRPGPKFYSPSIDKIKAELGYIQSNCRFVLWAINSFKHDGTNENMYAVASALLNKKNPTISNT